MKKIWLKVKTNNHYKIINKLRDINVSLYDIRKEKEYLYILINESSHERIKKYIVSYKFYVHEKVGVSKLIYIIKNNYLFFIMSLIGVVTFIIMNSLIVDVDIMHENKYIVQLIESELNKNNIKPLTFKKSYDELEKIKKKILDDNRDQIDWIEIETYGMKYVIKVEEIIIPSTSEEKNSCNVYASKDGLVTSINVSKGVAAVEIGDYIKKGDLLIEGQIVYNNEIKSEVCASGEVMANRWYETNVKVPYNYFEDIKTGKERYNLLLINGNQKTKILNDRIESYESEYSTIFNLFGYELLLENQMEVKREYKTYTEEEAILKALDYAKENMLLKLNDNESIIEKKVLKKSENNSTIEVDIFIVTNESTV